MPHRLHTPCPKLSQIWAALTLTTPLPAHTASVQKTISLLTSAQQHRHSLSRLERLAPHGHVLR
eukprot:COSAG01_NODE_1381_length_10520_cov_2.661710_6_plen_64_part_00